MRRLWLFLGVGTVSAFALAIACGGSSVTNEPLPPACAAGQSIACVSDVGCSGAQTCLADGSGFGPCECFLDGGRQDGAGEPSDSSNDALEAALRDAPSDVSDLDSYDGCTPWPDGGYALQCMTINQPTLFGHEPFDFCQRESPDLGSMPDACTSCIENYNCECLQAQNMITSCANQANVICGCENNMPVQVECSGGIEGGITVVCP